MTDFERHLQDTLYERARQLGARVSKDGYLYGALNRVCWGIVPIDGFVEMPPLATLELADPDFDRQFDAAIKWLVGRAAK
jgi:hypothetical protein